MVQYKKERKGEKVILKSSHTYFIGMLALCLVILAACSSDSSTSANLETQSENQIEKENIETEGTAETESPSTKEQGNLSSENTSSSEESNNDNKNTSSTEQDNSANKNTSSTEQGKMKEEYLLKVEEMKKEMDEVRANPEDSSTYALKAVEGIAFDAWDGMLNEIYGVLKEQLPTEKMNLLREEQREWIVFRDNSAKEASLKFQGGTGEQLEYVIVLNNLTEKRCFELVEQYM